VTWPGTTKLTVKGNGDITLWMATSKYNQAPAQATVATGTLFRFGEWHAIGSAMEATASGSCWTERLSRLLLFSSRS